MRFHEVNFKAMGSPCQLRFYSQSNRQAERAVKSALAEVHRLEQKYSRFLSTSELSRLNRAASQQQAINIDSETLALLDYAKICFEQSDGLFDITAGALHQIWRFSGKSAADDQANVSAPSQVDIDEVLVKVGFQHLIWQGSELRFSVPGLALDFGGIVKEHGADRAAERLQEAGVDHGVVDLGGDIRVLGPHPDGEPWQVYVRHPRKAGEHIAAFAITEGALASSGDYERYWMVDGERYSHLLSPRTGWPVKGLAAASVVADRCVVAGSVATIAMLRERQAAGWLGQLGCDHIWRDLDGRQGGQGYQPTRTGKA